MSQFPDAAVATRRSIKFIGGKPSVGLPCNATNEAMHRVQLGGKPTPIVTSCKVSALRASLIFLNERLLRNPFCKIRDFSVSDCSRKIHAKNEKRRNRKEKQKNKEMMCLA